MFSEQMEIEYDEFHIHGQLKFKMTVNLLDETGRVDTQSVTDVGARPTD